MPSCTVKTRLYKQLASYRNVRIATFVSQGVSSENLGTRVKFPDGRRIRSDWVSGSPPIRWTPDEVRMDYPDAIRAYPCRIDITWGSG